jgi:hypothetical protein
MSDNLDDFLRQAAERRAKRQQQKNSGAGQESSNAPTGRPVPPPTPPARPAQPPTSRPRQSSPSTNTKPKPQVVVADAVPQVVADTRSNVGNLQASLASRHVESNLEYADERMESHLKQSFNNDIRSAQGVRTLQQSEPAAGSTGKRPDQDLITSGDLKSQLRNPQTLRLAILAQEILKRPYP